MYCFYVFYIKLHYCIINELRGVGTRDSEFTSKVPFPSTYKISHVYSAYYITNDNDKTKITVKALQPQTNTNNHIQDKFRKQQMTLI